MSETAQEHELELQPQDYMTRLGSRLRVNYNREANRYVACFAGVFEKLDTTNRKLVQGIGKTELDACRALALKMRDLYRLGRLQVLNDGASLKDTETVVDSGISCNTWFQYR